MIGEDIVGFPVLEAARQIKQRSRLSLKGTATLQDKDVRKGGGRWDRLSNHAHRTLASCHRSSGERTASPSVVWSLTFREIKTLHVFTCAIPAEWYTMHGTLAVD